MRILIVGIAAMAAAGCASTSSQLKADRPAFNGHMAYEQARNERVNREIEMARFRQLEAQTLRSTNAGTAAGVPSPVQPKP